MINIYSLPSWLTAIYTLTLGIIVLRANPKANLNRTCFLLTVVSFGWLFSYGCLYSIHDPDKALIAAKIGHTFAVYVVCVVFYFDISILGPYTPKLDLILSKVSLVTAFIASLLIYTTKLYFVGITDRFWGYYPVGGPLMMIYTAWTFFVACRAIYILRVAARKASKDMQYDDYLRFKYHSLALSIFILAAVDFLPKFGFSIYPFGWAIVAGFSSLITYAIVRHKSFDVVIVIKRSYVYSTLITFMTLLYLLIVLISEHLFRSYVGYASLFTAFVAASVFALSFNPLRLKLQSHIDKQFLGLDPERLAAENIRLKDAVQTQDRLKAVATLAAGMAHEIKNPLTSIRTFAEYLPEKYADPEFRGKFKKIVVDEVDRVNSIVQQLLDFSKPREPELKPIFITDILDETLGLITSKLLDNKIAVSREFQASPEIMADRNQLKQAFLNLFLNSIQAMPQGGTLTVSTSLSGGHRLLVSVADTGVGIPKDSITHIFDPFYTTKEAGTGLGLSIVHGIVLKHRGKISVDSRQSAGTTFKLVFPIR